MKNAIQIIDYANLALAFIPVVIVIGILSKWSLNYKNALYAVFRMFIQLLLIGYVLVFIFESDNFAVVLAVLAVMIFASSWIALRTVRDERRQLIPRALYSILLGGGTTLILVTQGVLDLSPWYCPRYVIPLAGMIFANAMNSVSLAAERFKAEVACDKSYKEARSIAMRASLIPITNALFAVGLVSLPGMMTGQILSGISPLLAVRYQIMVMCMVYSSAGISSACFLLLLKSDYLIKFRHDSGTVTCESETP
jgi:putative ABC transport system permease protein